MATVYSSWITYSGARLRTFLTYTETDSNTAHSVSYSCGIQGYLTSSGPSTGLRVGVKASATGASDTAWHYINISNSTLHTYTAYSSSSPLSWDKTKTTQTKTLGIVSTAPIARLTQAITVPALPHWSVTYNANSGSGAPTTQTKWYNEALVLSSSKPAKGGYVFKGWATSQNNAKVGSVAYAAGGTISASVNSGLNLWAVWELVYSKPTITNLKIERCDENGNEDDEGTLAKVTFDWSVFNSSEARYYGGTGQPYANNAVDTCVVTVGSESVTLTDSDLTIPASIVVSSEDSFGTDTQYPVTVSITDTQAVQSSHTTTVAGTLATTYFPMDFNANATSVGFFMPAPDDREGVFIGKDITVMGGLTLNGDEAVADWVTEQGTSGSWKWRKWANGRFEAILHSSAGSTGSMTQLGSSGIYYSAVSEVTFPAAIGITAVDYVSAVCSPPSNFFMMMITNRLSTSSVYIGYIRFGSGSAVSNVDYSVKVEGTWA